MDKIGSSYIAFPDLIICGVALALFYCLTTLPPNSLLSRVLAGVCGAIVAAIVLVIPLVPTLTSDGVQELSMIGIGLAYVLWKWNQARRQSRLASVTPA